MTYQLSHNQRISCSRGLAAGKLNTATCKSYTYLFNTKTSEYFRCQVSLALTRDNKEVINVQTDGGCTKKPRIFETDAHYRSTPPRPSRRTPTRSSAPAATRSGPPTPRAEGARLHHHLLRPRLRHLQMPGHDVPVMRLAARACRSDAPSRSRFACMSGLRHLAAPLRFLRNQPGQPLTAVLFCLLDGLTRPLIRPISRPVWGV